MFSFQRYFIILLYLLSFMCLLSGCWKQHDTISIKSDGLTTFTSDVVITEEGFSVVDIEGLSSDFMNELRRAGWNVKRDWVSKAKPYKLVFSGEGNIRQVKNAPSFYTIQKINDNTIAITFIPAESKGKKSSRSIKFERGFFNSGPRILDMDGKEIKEIENVLKTQTYKIVF